MIYFTVLIASLLNFYLLLNSELNFFSCFTLLLATFYKEENNTLKRAYAYNLA